ncbi:hypothetical protein, partial [uncultured Oscillibacter sp.]|uniref:hypothetical protein n=1 Tax=uncultured Oscillibacter sp. TaxID=876091 RepID=UPI0034468463
MHKERLRGNRCFGAVTEIGGTGRFFPAKTLTSLSFRSYNEGHESAVGPPSGVLPLFFHSSTNGVFFMSFASPLYSPRFEHDACGIGAVVDIKGRKSHETVDSALKIVEKLEHRAGKDAAGETGDG